VADELLAALEHAHRHQVVHRNLNPSTVLLGSDGHLRLVGFDYARAGANRSQSLAGEILDDLEPAYLAPEVFADPAAASPASDVLSAGLILYQLFAGSPAFENLTELVDQEGQFPVKPSQLRSDLPAGLDAWLQALCVYQPEQRPSAPSARGRLAEISRTPVAGPAVEPETTSSEALPSVLPPDYLNLPPGHQLTSKFVVEKRLGKPGAFGVVYKVIDTFGDVARAVKIIVRDRHSLLERLKQEYRPLLQIPPHPHVVRVIDADLPPQLGLPIIVFEYVDGTDVAELIDTASFTPEDALAMARDAVNGFGPRA
jgi:serine/threonine protein kinase